MLPPAGHWGWLCTTTPAVSHPEIDFSSVTWARLAQAECNLGASMSADGVAFQLDLSALGSGTASTIGTAALTLPGLP